MFSVKRSYLSKSSRNMAFLSLIIIYMSLIIKSLSQMPEECKDYDPKVSTLIYNGTQATIFEYPFLASFENGPISCGAVILTTRVLMTAAHCLVKYKDPKRMKVVVGRTRVTVKCVPYYPKRNVYGVCRFVRHENFNKTTFLSNDIGMLLLRRRMKLGSGIKKARLPANDDFLSDYRENKFSTAGWGRIVVLENIHPENLMKTYLTLETNEICDKTYKRFTQKMGKDQFCLTGRGRTDTCKGDSGGGIVYRGLVVGLVSYGIKCGSKGHPSGFANVYHLKPWIKKTLSMFIEEQCPY